jgi:hypothetical protein
MPPNRPFTRVESSRRHEAVAGEEHRRSRTMMTRFLIEREIEGASGLTPEQLGAFAQTSNQAVE